MPMLKRKLKPCKQCLQPSYLFGHGMCQSCYKRHRLKPLSKVKKPTGELELFKQIWDERPRYSEVSGEPLGAFNVRYFSHVISKGSRPDLRLEPINIMLMTCAEHELWEFGSMAQKLQSGINFTSVYERLQWLKENFRK